MNQLIVDNIEEIIEHFNLDWRESKKCYLGTCPIHGGDNPTAFNFYHTGHTTAGNWFCNTHGCHNSFVNSGMGFITAILSVKNKNWSKHGDDTVNFAETIEWCENFFGTKYESNRESRDHMTANINRVYGHKNTEYILKITEKQYRQSGLEFPDIYFNKRGYSNKTLNKFGVGYCNNSSKPMYSRAVVPLYDKTGQYIIGCSGRSVFEKCNVCNTYHNDMIMCPPKQYRGIYTKWKNSNAFPAGSELYNYHQAIKGIKETGLAILTEGQPNVWRLDEAGFDMGLGCFGANFSNEQKNLLDMSGATTIIIVPDADKASEQFVESIKKACKYTYNIVTIEPSYSDDIGACNIQTVKEILSPFINKYREK